MTNEIDLLPILREFANEIARGNIEIYNEASIQYELAIVLREKICNYKVQLERNIGYFVTPDRRKDLNILKNLAMCPASFFTGNVPHQELVFLKQ